jgi:(heptosyl)LPS beta-1,4-glucosyltransferase
MHKLTCLIGTYNEAARLPSFLKHATKWADEIVIVDKSSTDNTRDLAKAAGALVYQVEFTPQGHEDKHEQFSFCTNDWVFLMTPGETPTRELIETVRSYLAQHGDTADIITIPKKLYSFGIHNPASPWSIGQQPFLLNRKRAIISNHVHQNFSIKPGGVMLHIPYSETCHVHHPTHATVTAFLRSHFDYIQAELDGMADPKQLLQYALACLNNNTFGNHQQELFGQECAWKLYWLGCCLAAWEKMAAGDVPAQYAADTKAMIEREWMGAYANRPLS